MAAVLGLSKADAVDYAKDGIRINCIAPGCIKTTLTKQLWEGPGAPIVSTTYLGVSTGFSEFPADDVQGRCICF